MTIRLTKIYTKTGDEGITSIANNERVHKISPLIQAVGDIDEANSAIGLITGHGNQDIFDQIQNHLFDLGADLVGSNNFKITQNHIDILETYIDGTNALLQPLDSFVLPTGQIHFARTVVRRAERSVWMAIEIHEFNDNMTINRMIPKYLNRLSDLLFVMARYYNKGNEKLWVQDTSTTVPSSNDSSHL